MQICRRKFVVSAALSGIAAMRGTVEGSDANDAVSQRRLGIGGSSYGIHSRLLRAQGFSDPIHFLEFCRQQGAGGIQTGLGIRDAKYCQQLRHAADHAEMFVEGSIRLPRKPGDVERFEKEVAVAKACGAEVLRTVMLGGRRYETFDSLEQFSKFRKDAFRSLQLSEPVVARQGMQLAVENHKDFLSSGLLEMIRGISSEFVGVCVDTGNNVALLEHPKETCESLAPWAMSCHLKDMAVQEYADGFLLAEVPLGQGFLDLPSIVATLRKALPALRFSLEMITRDPLKIPVLTKKYWATFPTRPAKELAAGMAMVRRHAAREPLSAVANLDDDARLRCEDENVRKSLDYAQSELGL